MKTQGVITMLKMIITASVFIMGLTLKGQDYFLQNKEIRLTKSDSIYSSQLKQLKIPDGYFNKKNRELPSSINNVDLPYFRPNFSQGPYWNCGQAAGVGYNFCYELNQARELPGNIPQNQYSVNFSFNFMNTGDGWGVSYFNSFDILKACGNPNLFDYGGLFNGESTRWMSGYNLYENAMQNRVRTVYSIDVSSPEGVLTLKHWLNDHLDGSEHGGVANFYLSAFMTRSLPVESPEADQPVIVLCTAPAGHAMTIVGYNDSIRYDLNDDGRFTNNEDINLDGIIDMKDWEIGGFRFMNSSTNNGGYGLILYSTLAHKYGEGGIWNQEVHAITIKESYTPIATIRIGIRHNSRNKIKLIAGISKDTTLNYPEHTMDFPILNYQGGDQYMQGDKEDELKKDIEVSLDISPLFSYTEPGAWSKFFIQVAEKDELNVGEGEVQFFSVVNYQEGLAETVSSQSPIPIANNAVTTLSVVTKIDFNKVNITTEELLAVVPGEHSTCQIVAEGGQSPYSWDVIQPYTLTNSPLNFPQEYGDQLDFGYDPIDGIEVNLPFPFPFFNDTISKITIFVNGFVMFEDKPYPYPYFIGEETLLKNTKSIAPFMSELILVDEKDDGVWVKGDQNKMEIIWQASNESYPTDSEVNFALILLPNGQIETHYGEMNYPESKLWNSGISKGDNTNYTINSFYNHLNQQNNRAFTYEPPTILPDNIEIDENGLLSLLVSEESDIYSIIVQVTDDNNIVDRKQFQVPSGLTYEYEVQAGTDNLINYYDTVSVKFIIKNTSQEEYHLMHMNFSCDDPYFTIIKDQAWVGNLSPQQTIVIDSALILLANPGNPDQNTSVVSSNISSSEKQWSADISLLASSPEFRLSDIVVSDNQNGILEPGETATLELELSNIGHADLYSFQVEMIPQPDYFEIDNPVFNIDDLNVGSIATLRFDVKAQSKLQSGKEVQIHFNFIKDDATVAEVMKPLTVGKIPVLVLDLDPQQISGPLLKDLMDSMNLINTYSRKYPKSFDQYMSVFVCLGTLFNNVELSAYEANRLLLFSSTGGNIYMEGGVTWKDDISRPLHTRFNIETISYPYYVELESFYGVTGQFTKNMKFSISSTIPFTDYNLSPIGEAYPLLNIAPEDSICTIAFDGGNYKTIGSMIAFGALTDSDTISTKKNYLHGILEFFGLTDYMLSDQPIINVPYNRLNIDVWPNPFRDELTIRVDHFSGKWNGLEIFDLSGKMVNKIKLPASIYQNGSLTIVWDGKDLMGKNLPKGLYLIKLGSDKAVQTKKVLLL